MKRIILLATILVAVFSSCKKSKDESAVPEISPLNAKFTVNGSMKDYGSNLFSGHYPHDIVLEKSAENKGTMVPTAVGIPGHAILANGNPPVVSYYSNFGIIITIDGTTNKIVAITNHYGQPSPTGRSATLDPSGVNAWNPSTKEIRIKYWMDEPAVYQPHRVAFDETWIYTGPK